MKQNTKLTALLLAALMTASAASSCGYGKDYIGQIPLKIEDAALEKGLRDAIGKQDGGLFASDFEGVTKLDLSGSGITDISALAELDGIEVLDISENEITDISALAALDGLNEVHLYGNSITDYSAVREVPIVVVGDDVKITLPNAASHSLLIRGSYLDGNPFSGRLDDDADIITEEEEAYMTPFLEDIEDITGVDSSIVIIDSTEGYESVDDFAQDYFASSNESHEEAPGRLLIAGTSDNKWKIIVSGIASTIFSQNDLDAITNRMERFGETDAVRGFAILKEFLGGAQDVINSWLKESGSDVRLVTVSDPALDTALRTLTGKTSGLMTLADFADITELDLSGLGITDISGLAELTHLTSLDLSDNSVSDISPLAGLVSLKYLNLANNSFTDLSALEELSADTELDLGGITPDSWEPVNHIENVIGRTETPSVTPEGYPITSEGNYHSVITSHSTKTSPAVSALNDAAGFLSVFEEALINGYLDSVSSKHGYEISFVTIASTEGYDLDDDFYTGVFNADYRKYNGFVKETDYAMLSMVSATGDWVLTAKGATFDIIESSETLADYFDVDLENGVVVGNGYEKLLEFLYNWIDSL